MNHPTESIALQSLMEILSQPGMTGMLQALNTVYNHALVAERDQYLGARPYERTEQRRDQANGFKHKAVKTPLGVLDLWIPQVRNGGFFPQSLQRGQRSETALVAALAEMYVQGVSTRRVTKILKTLCGTEVSSSMVSRATAELDEILGRWRERPLGEFHYVYLDARYENVRYAGAVRDCAVLWAIGVSPDGKRDVLGVSVALSEAEVHWRAFLESLLKRGLTGLRLVISDDHAGLGAARKAVLPSVPWQRCQFHLQQNVHAHIPKKDLIEPVHNAIRSIFEAGTLTEANQKLSSLAASFDKTAPKLADWLREAIPQGLTVFTLPDYDKLPLKRLRTTNGIERANQEIKRRTRTVRIFPNPDSCLRLVSAILMEIAEDWSTGNTYITNKT